MKNRQIKYFLTFGWVLCAAIIFFSSLKSQLVLSEELKLATNTIFPQGWGFFTKNPQDFAINIYKIENKKLILIDIKNQSFKNRLGFSRSARIIGYEMSTVVSDIQNKDWVRNTDGNIYSNIDDKIVDVENREYFNHLKKGEYLVKLYKPIPYAWSNDNQEKFNPFSVVKIKIK